MTIVHSRKHFHDSGIATHSSLLPFLSQEMSLNIDIKKIHPVKVSGVSPKSLKRCESWEDVPLEFSRLSIESIIIFVVVPGLACNSVLPSFVGIRMLKNPSEALHRIREVLDFCALKIDDCFITSVTVFSMKCFTNKFCPNN